MGNWSMRRRMMEPLWMTANQEPTVSPTNRRISAWCAAGRRNQGGTVQHCAALVVAVRG